jgi:cytidyltransferase-like protein
MRIGLIAGSYKPVHVGHYMLIERAAAENDKVMLYVSISDRARPGEVPISGVDMHLIWQKYIAPTLPPNVEVEYGGSPVRKIYDFLGKANETSSKDKFTVYSDPQDLAQNFPEKNMKKYVPKIWKNKQVSLVPGLRTSTVDVSGTKMRGYLQTGDKKSFLKNMPAAVNGDAIWNILAKPKTESVLREYVSHVLNEVHKDTSEIFLGPLYISR